MLIAALPQICEIFATSMQQADWGLPLSISEQQKLWVKYLNFHPGDFCSVSRQGIGLTRFGCPFVNLKQNCGHANNAGHSDENTR